MAKIFKGIFGPVSGKIGSVVGATWKNIPYLRSLPRKKKKKTARTPAQIANQQKFKFVTEWLVPFYPYISNGFRHLAQGRTEINAAFSLNYKSAVGGVYPDLSISYPHVFLSKGDLPGLMEAEVSLLGTDSIHLSWGADNRIHHISFNDQVMLVIYSPELKMADGFIGGVKRADHECTYKMHPKMLGQALEVYVSTYTLNGKTMSDSQYIGRIAP
ncbi:DUF6266 family protein [Pedobacter nutrimenti]|uniref:DUF6266 family protein n=1 Tax=Pedobacter nutrimenti TaxID=1241337 RepID=UPI0029308D78|nr:DUF6266 family protein [Pedobacter nutrimenti]